VTLARYSCVGECEGLAGVGAARVWVLGGLVFGIPGSTVANLILLSQPAAAFRKRLPLGWANPILVVEGCNLTAIGDEMSRTFSAECTSVGSDGAVSIESEGRWSVDRSASLRVGQGYVPGARRKEIGAGAERHTECSVAEAFFLEEVPGVVWAADGYGGRLSSSAVDLCWGVFDSPGMQERFLTSVPSRRRPSVSRFHGPEDLGRHEVGPKFGDVGVGSAN
jgi:hypothetical protein